MLRWFSRLVCVVKGHHDMWCRIDGVMHFQCVRCLRVSEQAVLR